jgi:hypothetical protein
MDVEYQKLDKSSPVRNVFFNSIFESPFNQEAVKSVLHLPKIVAFVMNKVETITGV